MAIVVPGMGFFTDANDLFCISLITKLLGPICYTDPTKPDPGSLPPNVAALCGTLAGQLFFGCLGDKLGRKSVYGMTLLLMVICSVASGSPSRTCLRVSWALLLLASSRWHLLGTATTWFLVDVASYSQNLFQKDIFTSIHWIPKARTMSWQVDWSWAEKISVGTINVVTFGPKLAKKKVGPYNTTNPVWCLGSVQCSYGTAIVSMNTVIVRNPMSWVQNLPTMSIMATVHQYLRLVPQDREHQEAPRRGRRLAPRGD